MKSARQASAFVLSSILLMGCANDPYYKPASTVGIATKDVVASHTAMVTGEKADQTRLSRAQEKAGGYNFVTSVGCDSLQVLDTSGCGYEGRLASPGPTVRSRQAVELRRREEQAVAAQTSPIATSIASSGDPSFLPPAPDACLKTENAIRVERVGAAAILDAARHPEKQVAGKPPITEAEILHRLSSYADGLIAITDTSDRVAFEAATNKLAASAGALATTVGTLAGGVGGIAIGPVIVAAVKLGAFATERGYASARHEALRETMLETCLPFRKLAAAEGLLLQARKESRIGINREVTSLVGLARLKPGADRSGLFALGIEATDAINSMRESPLATARAMIEAHDNLAVAVIENKGQAGIIEAAFTQFLERAGDFRSAVSSGPAAK